MRAALTATALAALLFVDVARAHAQDAGVVGGAAVPARTVRRPRASPAAAGDAAATDAAPAAGAPGAPAAPAGSPPPAPDAPDATPPTAQDGASRPQRESREVRESREERERWRVPSDLVNPFLDDPRYDDDDLESRGRRRRGRDESSWFIAEEDLVDPWRDGRLGPFYGVRCAGRWCRPDRESAVFLTAPEAEPGPARRRHRRSVELAALVAAATVADDARARLEVQATIHRGAFGIGLALSTSTGDVPIGLVTVTHPRHAIALVLEHRLTGGTLSLDLGVAAGVMLMELDEAEVMPLARVMATAGIPIVRNVEAIVRADATTTFARPGDRRGDGPSAFEFAMGLGLRISTR